MRNFTPLCIFLLFFPCFWSGCDDRSVRHRMLEAEARFDTVPSDIFRLLSEVGSPDSLSSEDRALYDLLTLRSYSIGVSRCPTRWFDMCTHTTMRPTTACTVHGHPFI